jgi:hypothetical protein
MMNSEKPKKPVDRHSGESRNPGFPGENREPGFEMVPDFRRDDAWAPVFTGETAFYETINDG